jgi:hypothetical protein
VKPSQDVDRQRSRDPQEAEEDVGRIKGCALGVSNQTSTSQLVRIPKWQLASVPSSQDKITPGIKLQSAIDLQDIPRPIGLSLAPRRHLANLIERAYRFAA